MLQQLIEALKSRGMSDAEIQAVIREAQLKSQLAQLTAQFVRQVIANGGWQDGFGSLSLEATIVENDNGDLVGWAWKFNAKHGLVGSIELTGQIDLPSQSQSQSQNDAHSGQVKSRGQWAKVIDLASKYNIEIKPYEQKALAWYTGAILTRIAKQAPQAKNDPEFLSLVEVWNAQKSAQAPAAKID